jgi:spore coat polysaccharide biosynthesis protein SpsF (cytidylyltransferase family)
VEFKVILAILQARLSSTRMPEKVLKPIVGKPMLQLQIERIKRSKKIDQFIIATSDDESDRKIADLSKVTGMKCSRGSLNDVLARFYHAATPFQPKTIIRLTGDCPLVDPGLIDQCVDFYLEGNFDYVSNTIKPTYPDGLDVEVFKFSALKKAFQFAKLPSEREHVTPFIHQQPNHYPQGNYANEIDLSHLRWTVDEQEDYQFVSRVYEHLYPLNPSFTTQDILQLLKEKPELMKINQKFSRNEGFQKSIDDDKKWLEEHDKK